MKALLLDAVCPNSSSLPPNRLGSTKVTLASKGLTAAGASLLASDYVDNETGVGNRQGDGSDRPIRDRTGILDCVTTPIDHTPIIGQTVWEDMSVKDFLIGLQLDHLYFDLFQREHITMDVLVEMSHNDLASIGLSAFGHRHKIIRKVKELIHNGGAESAEPVGVAKAQHKGTQLIELSVTDKEFIAVSEEVCVSVKCEDHVYDHCVCVCVQVQSTICEHRDDGRAGGVFKSYNILKVSPSQYEVHLHLYEGSLFNSV